MMQHVSPDRQSKSSLRNDVETVERQAVTMQFRQSGAPYLHLSIHQWSSRRLRGPLTASKERPRLTEESNRSRQCFRLSLQNSRVGVVGLQLDQLRLNALCNRA